MIQPTSLSELEGLLQAAEESFVLIYKAGSEQSECAASSFKAAGSEYPEAAIYGVDVAQIRDIHPAFGVSSAPTLLIFRGTALQSSVKGCQNKEFYLQVIKRNSFGMQAESQERPIKNVIVYSTPTCSWCNTLKSWLRKNQVTFREIDVSKDQSAAEAMVRKSGQQGVPQTEINGQMVVGFDQNRLKNLLGINS